MKPVTSFTSGLDLNTDRIAAASRQNRVHVQPTEANNDAPAFQASAFRREIPMPRNAEFVELNGKKYFLNAPRGTYVNILV